MIAVFDRSSPPGSREPEANRRGPRPCACAHLYRSHPRDACHIRRTDPSGRSGRPRSAPANAGIGPGRPDPHRPRLQSTDREPTSPDACALVSELRAPFRFTEGGAHRILGSARLTARGGDRRDEPADERRDLIAEHPGPHQRPIRRPPREGPLQRHGFARVPAGQDLPGGGQRVVVALFGEVHPLDAHGLRRADRLAGSAHRDGSTLWKGKDCGIGSPLLAPAPPPRRRAGDGFR